MKAFWVQKLPRRRHGEAQRRHKVTFLLLFTMVSACYFVCCFQVLGLLLVPFWCHFGLSKGDFWTPKKSQNPSKMASKMGPKNDRHLGGSVGGVLGSRHRAAGQQAAEPEPWEDPPKRLGNWVCLRNCLFCCLELRIYTP